MNKTFVQFISICLLGSINTACSVFGVRNEEQPQYKVLLQQDNKEVRQYSSYIIAKTTVQGSFKEAQSKGFKILAGYIFGKNKAKSQISMTAPVVQKPEPANQKIAMTAPVILKPSDNENQDSWTMTFSMPSKYNLETLPEPEDKRVVLQKVEPKLVAVLSFTGFWNKEKNQKKADELVLWIQQGGQYKPSSEPMFAGYNPPWTIPFFRRNEMMVEVEKL